MSLSLTNQATKYSLLARGIFLHTIMIFGFVLIYVSYTYLIHDDFNLKQNDNFMYTVINCIYATTLLSANTFPNNVTTNSILSRIIVTTHVILSSFLKIWLITT